MAFGQEVGSRQQVLQAMVVLLVLTVVLLHRQVAAVDTQLEKVVDFLHGAIEIQ